MHLEDEQMGCLLNIVSCAFMKKAIYLLDGICSFRFAFGKTLTASRFLVGFLPQLKWSIVLCAAYVLVNISKHVMLFKSLNLLSKPSVTLQFITIIFFPSKLAYMLE